MYNSLHDLYWKSPIIVALDRDGLEGAELLVEPLKRRVWGFKIGLQLMTAVGAWRAVDFLRELSVENIFLDGKFMGTPDAVFGAVQGVSRIGVSMLTVHCLGGRAMMKAAAEAARVGNCAGRPAILGVTILTSMDQSDLREMGFAPKTEMPGIVLHLASLAKEAGLDGVIASPYEAEMLRKRFGHGFRIVTPGIRPKWWTAGKDDQKRFMEPQEALRLGADQFVIGRPITEPSSPMTPLETIQRIEWDIEEVKDLVCERVAAIRLQATLKQLSR